MKNNTSGHPMAASYPADTMINSGWNWERDKHFSHILFCAKRKNNSKFSSFLLFALQKSTCSLNFVIIVSFHPRDMAHEILIL